MVCFGILFGLLNSFIAIMPEAKYVVGFNRCRHALMVFGLLMLVAVLSACSALQQTIEDLTDQISSSQGTVVIRLSRWTDDVPQGTLLQIDRSSHEVYIAAGESKQLLGNLEYQLPDAPVKTMFFDTGTTKFIIGFVDESVAGHLTGTLIGRYAPPDEHRPVDGGSKLNAMEDGSRTFFIPIFPNEVDRWQKLDGVYIFTDEASNAESRTGHRWAFKKDYRPYLDVSSWYLKVVANKK